jgi:hypothetical protein
MREAKHGRCARLGRSVAQSEAGQMREARPGRCDIQASADERLKAR